jgi:hypothetical protein
VDDLLQHKNPKVGKKDLRVLEIIMKDLL